jgi:hypothetical protein
MISKMNVALTALDETSPQKEKLRIIDEAIEKQQRVIDELLIPLLALKSQRNASVSISRLPPEILCRIFSFAQEQKLDGKGRKVAPLEWINLTYVCSHWRRVAVNAPSLWVDPPIGNFEWVAEMLRRSKESSLVINIDDRMLGMELALGNIHRVRELSIRHVTSKKWNIMKGMLLVSAPRLERLCLVRKKLAAHYGPDGRVRRTLAPLSISEDILQQTGPLRQLELEHCELSWISHSHLLSSLTHLKLHNISYPSQNSTFAVTEKQFMDALKSMPDLEVLNLRYALPKFEAEQQVSQLSKDIHFPRLQTLHIHDEVSAEFEAFFRNITFPSTAMVKVVCQKWGSDGTDYDDSDDDDDDDFDEPCPDYSEIISGLLRSYSNLRPEAAFKSLILQRSGPYQYSGGIRLKLFTEIFDDFDMISRIEAPSRLDLLFRCTMVPQKTTQIFSDIRTSGILDDLTHVYIPEWVGPELTPKAMANTLGQLPRIHSVVVASTATKSFLRSIVFGSCVSAAATSGSSGNSQLAVPFPCLSSIYLSHAKFVEPHLVGYAENKPMSIEELQHILMRRCDFGAPIDMLFLQECSGVSEEDKKFLREILVDLEP